MTKKTIIVGILAIMFAAPAIFAADQSASKPKEKPDFKGE
jgi:hypothetical protein